MDALYPGLSEIETSQRIVLLPKKKLGKQGQEW